MSITQKSLIEDMENAIKDEIYFLIEMKGYNMDHEKELNKKVKEMRKNFNALLSNMNIKKRVNISLFTILAEIASKAYDHKIPYFIKLNALYDKIETSWAM